MKRTEREYQIMQIDPWLASYKNDINMRMKKYKQVRKCLLRPDESLLQFANGYLYFGFHRTASGWVFREWLPGADKVHLIGDFNDWNKSKTPLKNIGNGVWEVTFRGRDSIRHGQFVKLWITRGKDEFERLPAYIRRAKLNEQTHQLCGQVWMPEKEFEWTDADHSKRKKTEPLIYEAHIGMAQEREGIGTYR